MEMIGSIQRDNATPLWQQIERHLRAWADEQGGGAQMPSERELCEKFAVQRGTVRMAIDSLVRKGVLERRERSGTYVAASTASGPIALVQFHMPSASDPAFLTHIQGIEEGLADTEHRLLPFLILPKGPPVETIVDSLRAARVAGLIFDRFQGDSDIALMLRLAEEYPAVVMSKEFRETPMPCARAEICESTGRLARYMAERGCRTIGVLGGDPQHIALRSRAESFTSAVRALGITDVRVHWRPWAGAGELAVQSWLQDGVRPVGIFANIASSAVYARRMAAEAGLTPGKDVFFATVPPEHQVALCSGMAMAVRDEVGIGRAAARLLLGRIGGTVSAHDIVDVPCKMVLP